MSPGTVLKEDGVFKMRFYGGVGLAEHGYWGNSSQAIGYATSLDGINWTVYDRPETAESPLRFSDPVLTASQLWEGDIVVNPSVIRTADGYQMWYVGYHDNVGAIGHAASPDRISWTKNDGHPEGNPVLALPGWCLQPAALPFGPERGRQLQLVVYRLEIAARRGVDRTGHPGGRVITVWRSGTTVTARGDGARNVRAPESLRRPGAGGG